MERRRFRQVATNDQLHSRISLKRIAALSGEGLQRIGVAEDSGTAPETCGRRTRGTQTTRSATSDTAVGDGHPRSVDADALMGYARALEHELVAADQRHAELCSVLIRGACRQQLVELALAEVEGRATLEAARSALMVRVAADFVSAVVCEHVSTTTAGMRRRGCVVVEPLVVETTQAYAVSDLRGLMDDHHVTIRQQLVGVNALLQRVADSQESLAASVKAQQLSEAVFVDALRPSFEGLQAQLGGVRAQLDKSFEEHWSRSDELGRTLAVNSTASNAVLRALESHVCELGNQVASARDAATAAVARVAQSNEGLSRLVEVALRDLQATRESQRRTTDTAVDTLAHAACQFTERVKTSAVAVSQLEESRLLATMRTLHAEQVAAAGTSLDAIGNTIACTLTSIGNDLRAQIAAVAASSNSLSLASRSSVAVQVAPPLPAHLDCHTATMLEILGEAQAVLLAKCQLFGELAASVCGKPLPEDQSRVPKEPPRSSSTLPFLPPHAFDHLRPVSLLSLRALREMSGVAVDSGRVPEASVVEETNEHVSSEIPVTHPPLDVSCKPPPHPPGEVEEVVAPTSSSSSSSDPEVSLDSDENVNDTSSRAPPDGSGNHSATAAPLPQPPAANDFDDDDDGNEKPTSLLVDAPRQTATRPLLVRKQLPTW